MKLRSATVNEVETLFDIRCSVTENYQSREELATLNITVDSVERMIAIEDYITLIAETGGRPIGFTMAQISEGYIFACFVRPEFEGQGIGGALMAALEAGLRSAGVKRAWLSTGSEQAFRAIGFYRHLGWTDAGYLEDGQIRFEKVLQEA